MSSKKVFVINDPGQIARRQSKSGGLAFHPERAQPSKGQATALGRNPRWWPALRAYVLGPLNLVFSSGNAAWTTIGGVSIVLATGMFVGRHTLQEYFHGLESGALLWIMSVLVTTLLVSAAWARSIIISDRAARWPAWLRTSAAVCTLGLMFPGLGLLITRQRWKAALAVWSASLLGASIVIAKNWRWLAGAGDGQTYRSVELILAAAVVGIFVGALAWLALAFDGLRAVSPDRRSGFLANGLALVLVVTLATFFLTFRPAPIARDLSIVAAPLRHEGLRMIPFALYEAASVLDPGTPSYLAEAAAIAEDIGWTDRANARKFLLERRARRFAEALGAELVAADGDVESSASSDVLHPLLLTTEPQWPLSLPNSETKR